MEPISKNDLKDMLRKVYFMVALENKRGEGMEETYFAKEYNVCSSRKRVFIMVKCAKVVRLLKQWAAENDKSSASMWEIEEFLDSLLDETRGLVVRRKDLVSVMVCLERLSSDILGKRAVSKRHQKMLEKLDYASDFR